MTIYEKIQSLPPDEQEIAVNYYLRESAKKSLFYTARNILGYSEINVRTHGDVIKTLELDNKRKLIVMPRGSFKSSICSVAYPIWMLLRNPNLRILLDGELYTNSKNFLREIKLHLKSVKLTKMFGNFENRSCWSEGEIIINQRDKVLKEASITASGIGSEKTGQHFDLIIMDDLNSPSNSQTQEGRDKVIQHYRYNISILEPNGIMVVVGTRYSELDVIGYILKNEIGDNNG